MESCCRVPLSAVAVKDTRAIYSLGLDQISGERQKNYLQHLLLDRPSGVFAGAGGEAIGIDIALRVLGGTSTVGGYSRYTGLVSQLWSGVYGLSSAVIQIYDN